MKVLLRKIKKANKASLTIYILFLLLFLGGYIFFARSLLSLVGIETFIRIVLLVLFFLWFLVYFLFGLSTILVKKYKKFIALTIFQILFIAVMIFSSFVIYKLYSKIELLTTDEYTLYTTNLIALNSTDLTNNSKLGMIDNNEDIEGYVLANSLIAKENLKQNVVYYEDYYTMLAAFYKKEIDAIFVSSNYSILFSNEETYKNIALETKVLYSYSEKMKSKTITNTNKKLTEPFTVLLMGVDSEYNGLNANAAFNGDTLMLISFNPNTLTATMLSIPRDTYVPIACNHNRSHKINSAAAYGTECVINTVQNLVGVHIDYYAKINFRGVIDLVNTLGGVDVNVEAPDYSSYIKKYGQGVLCESDIWRDYDPSKLVCMNTGIQHLNGEQALAYARNRHGYLESDLARNRHQQQLVEALAEKLLHINSFSDVEKLLDVIGNNIATNLSTNQILSFYQALKNMVMESIKGDGFINIQKTYLEVYNLPIMMSGMQLSALGYYQDSLKAIQEAMEINLGIKKEEMIKTFSYDYNEVYESPIIGKGITTGVKEKTVPNFIGKTISDAQSWADENGITLTTSYICSTNTPGLIGNQSISSGTSVRSISAIEIYVNQVCDENDTGNEMDNSNENNQDFPGLPSDNTTTPQDNEDNNIDNNSIIPGIPNEDDV